MYIIWYHSWVDEDHSSAILVIMRIQRVLIIAMSALSLFFGFGKKRVPCGTDQQEQRWDGGLHPFSDSSFWSSDASMVLQCPAVVWKIAKAKDGKNQRGLVSLVLRCQQLCQLLVSIINFNISQLISAASSSVFISSAFPRNWRTSSPISKRRWRSVLQSRPICLQTWRHWQRVAAPCWHEMTGLWVTGLCFGYLMLLGFVPDMDAWKMQRLPISAKLLSWWVFFDVMKLVCMAGCSGIDMHFFKRKVNLAHRPSFRFDDV